MFARAAVWEPMPTGLSVSFFETEEAMGAAHQAIERRAKGDRLARSTPAGAGVVHDVRGDARRHLRSCRILTGSRRREPMAPGGVGGA